MESAESGETEPIHDLELLPAYITEPDEAVAVRPRLPPGAFRLLAPPARAWTATSPTRARWRNQLWVDPPSAGPRPWADGAVRRFVDLPFPLAIDALTEVATSPLARLELDLEGARTTTGEHWVAGTLRVHRCGRPVRVEVVVEPWSAGRSDLRLQVRCDRGRVRLARLYFDVAHDAVDELRLGIAASHINWRWISAS